MASLAIAYKAASCLQDEPTNYLDRDALGALAEAIKEYGGGVIMISHSSEFTSALCPEKWTVADGKLTIEGQTDAQKEQAKLEWKRQEEMTDAFGNTIKVKAPKKVRLLLTPDRHLLDKQL